MDSVAMKNQKLPTSTVDSVPTTISSPQAKLVYLYLEVAGEATVDDLRETLALDKLSILSVISSLRSESIVEKNGDTVTVA